MTEEERDFYKSIDHNISINDDSKAIRLCTIGKVYYFSYKKYGGKTNALLAARKFRDSLPVESFRGLYDCDKCKPKGISNYLGVVMSSGRDGAHTGWVACWQSGKPGRRKQKIKRFSFFNYGEKAFILAIEHRKKMVKKNSIMNSLQ